MPPLSADDLYQAFDRVRENEGCAGADGITIYAFAQRLHHHLPDLLLRVQQDRYRPYPLLKIVVEKRPGAPEPCVRTLLVPAVRDLQTAAARRLSRSFEEEFLECSYGYRPGRSVDRAIAHIRRCREPGHTLVADADIATFIRPRPGPPPSCPCCACGCIAKVGTAHTSAPCAAAFRSTTRLCDSPSPCVWAL